MSDQTMECHHPLTVEVFTDVDDPRCEGYITMCRHCGAELSGPHDVGEAIQREMFQGTKLPENYPLAPLKSFIR